jgi:hypothetical protein
MAPIEPKLKMPILMLLASISCLVYPTRGIIRLIKEYENTPYFLNNISYYSLAYLIITNFNYFAIFMIAGLSVSQGYFQFLSLSALSMLIASVIINKFCALVFKL